MLIVSLTLTAFPQVVGAESSPMADLGQFMGVQAPFEASDGHAHETYFTLATAPLVAI